MQRLLTLSLILMGSASCLVPTKPTARSKFISFEHEGWNNLNIMIKKVHAPHWTIHYSYGDNCPAEQRNNDAALTAAVSEGLQMWLQPLRTYSPRPIVNDFRYRLDADKDAADFGIIFYCDIGSSWAMTGQNSPPRIEMHDTLNVKQVGFMTSLAHEIGHIFGLADTYIPIGERGKPGASAGGLASTKGTQPSSKMMGVSQHKGEGILGRDDKNGIIWLYKVFHEGLSIRDCFFSDYELEHAPLGCRPKHPLIFELKHASEKSALFVIRDDEKLDVNAQDAEGMTALHYAVSDGYERVVETLIKRDDIKPFLKNKQGQTPLQLAEKLQHDKLAQLIAAHPKALPVDAKGKRVTTWGEMKKGGR